MRPSHMQRARLALVGHLVALAGGCRHTWVATPPARAVPAATVETSVAHASDPALATASGGWRAATTSAVPAASERGGGRRALRALVARAGPLRVVVYHDASISPAPDGWHASQRDVVEYERTGGGAPVSERVTARTELADPPTRGRGPADETVAAALESRLVRDLIAAGARVLDRALLYRLSAARERTGELTRAELAALQRDVDLVVEATFVRAPGSEHGVELRLRAIRTRGARVLAVTSTQDVGRASAVTSMQAVAGRGFEPVTTTRTLTLDERAAEALDRLLGEVSAGY